MENENTEVEKVEAPSFTNSRLIVKNLPKHLTEDRMKEHFGNSGEFIVTDVKIMRKGALSRQFGFIGFKSERHAKAALKHFSNSYVDTSKIELEYAKQQGDESIPRAWSRHTEGSSAYKITHKEDNKRV